MLQTVLCRRSRTAGGRLRPLQARSLGNNKSEGLGTYMQLIQTACSLGPALVIWRSASCARNTG